MVELGPAVLLLALFTSLVGFVIAVASSRLLALPAYQLLRRWWRLRWWSSALAGFVIGTLPIAAVVRNHGRRRSDGLLRRRRRARLLGGPSRRPGEETTEDLDQTFA